MKVLSKADGAALAIYAEAFAEFMFTVEAIGKSRLLIKDRDGNLRRNPLLRIRDAAVERLARMAAQLGLTPAARTRLRPVEEPQPLGTKARFFNPGA
jgi:P27 family predicted phage terminase small subunit